MQGVNPTTMQCIYSTPCDYCTKWDKKCDKKFGCGNWFTSEFEEYVTKVIAMFQINQYICSVCGKIISPEVEFDKDGKVDMTVDKAEACGCLGNKTLLDNVCPECAKKIRI
jgi:hypothetical protein